MAAHSDISAKQSALWNEGDLRRRLSGATPGFLFTYDEAAWRDPNVAKPARLGGPKKRVAPARQAVLVEALEDPALPPDHLAGFLKNGGLAAWTGCRRDDESKQCAWDQISPLVALSWGERPSLEAVLHYGIINPDDPIYGRRAAAEPGEAIPNPYSQNRFDRGYALTCKGGTLGVDFNKKGRANTYSKPCWWPDNFEGFNVNGLGVDTGWDPRMHAFLFNTRTREIWHIVRPG